MKALSLILSLALACAACDDGESSSTPDNDFGLGGQGGTGGFGGSGGTVDPDSAVPDNVTLAITEPANGAFLNTPTVRVRGTYTGNPSQIKVNGTTATLAADKTFSASVSLTEDGVHTLTATAGDASAISTITLDTVAPRIDIMAPGRGVYSAEETTDLRFVVDESSALASVTLNGLDIPPGRGPDFTQDDVFLSPGLNIEHIEVTDSAGNASREHTAILYGELAQPDGFLPSALRLHVGTGALANLEQLAISLIDEQELASLLPVEPISAGPLTVRVTDIEYQRPANLELTLAPTERRVNFDLRLDEVTMDLGLYIGSSEIPVPITVGARSLTATGGLYIHALNGELVTEVQDLSVVFDDLQLTVARPPEFDDIPGGDDGLIEEIVGDLVVMLIERELPTMIDGFIGQIDEPIDVDALGAQLRLSLRPNVVVVSQDGLSLRVDVQVELLNPPSQDPPVAGYITTPSQWDGVPSTDQIGLAIDDDLINALAYQVWRAGVLFPTIDRAFVAQAPQLRAITTLLANILTKVYPDVRATTPLKVVSAPMLPIHARPLSTPTANFEVAMGHLLLNVSTDDAQQRELLQGSASLILKGKLGVKETSTKMTLDLVISESVNAFDALTEELRGAHENEVEEPFLDLLGNISTLIPGILSAVPLPTFEFVDIGNIQVGTAGPNGDFLTLTAELSAN